MAEVITNGRAELLECCAQRLYRNPVRVSAEAAMFEEVVNERGVDHAVRGRGSAPQAIEVVAERPDARLRRKQRATEPPHRSRARPST